MSTTAARYMSKTVANALTLQSTATLSTGHKIPLLGLGVYLNSHPTEACLAALNAGYRHIDTATGYRNEAAVGSAVRASGVSRADVFVTSKIGSSQGHGYGPVRAAVDASLAKLQTPYIDLYLLHDPLAGKVKRLDSWSALIDAKKEGKVRAIGVSNYGPHHLNEIVAAGLEVPSVNQVELHPFCQQREIVDWCEKHGVLVEAYCPIIRMAPGKIDHNVVNKLVAKHKKKATHIVLRWSLQKGFIPLPKSSKAERVIDNADLYDFELDNADMVALDSLDMGAKGAISWNPVDAD